MKIRTDLTLRQIGRSYMVVELSDQGTNLTNVYTMNETAAWLWKEFVRVDFTEEMLVKRLCEEYEVTEEKAAEDVARLVGDWKEMGLIH